VTTHVGNETWTAVDDSVGCSSSIIDTLRLLFTCVDTFFHAATPLLPYSLSVMAFFVNALNECINHYATTLHMSCGDEAAVRASASPRGGALISTTSAVLTRARSILTMDVAPKEHPQALSHQTVQSLCVRLCNLSIAKQRLPALQAHLAEQWETMKAACSEELREEAERVEGELHLLSQEHSPLDGHISVGPFSNAFDRLCQCSQAVLSMLASRVVYVDWNTPLLTVLYLPLPSSPAVNFADCGFMELLDSTMVELFKRSGESNFSSLCEWVYRYLMQALDWTLVGRERPKGQGLFDPGVITAQDVAVLEQDWSAIRELFVDDLGEDKLRALSAGYETLLQRLKHRAQSNQHSAQATAVK
jgi:hypothetical protein